MKLVLVFLVATVAACSARNAAQDPDAPPERPALSSQAAEQGKAQFQQLCGFCHGRDARGGASGPDLLRSSLVSHDVGGNLIAPVVRGGRPDKGMPAFQLSDEAIQRIAAYLHAEASQAATVASKVPSDYPVQTLLVGSARAGQAYFAQHCQTCHSASGDLAHVASKYKPFDLQTHIAFPSGAKPVITVRTKEGDEVSGDQVYADEFFVSLRDKTGAIRTWKRGTAEIAERDPLAAHVQLLKSYSDKDLHDLFAYLETLK